MKKQRSETTFIAHCKLMLPLTLLIVQNKMKYHFLDSAPQSDEYLCCPLLSYWHLQSYRQTHASNMMVIFITPIRDGHLLELCFNNTHRENCQLLDRFIILNFGSWPELIWFEGNPLVTGTILLLMNFNLFNVAPL